MESRNSPFSINGSSNPFFAIVNGADPYLQEYNQIVDDYGVSDEMGAVWTE